MGILATPEGTDRYARRLAGRVAPLHFRSWPGGPGQTPEAGAGAGAGAEAGAGFTLRLSSIGFGSYTGSADDEGDRQYREAVQEAIRSGVNVIDCAINYRNMRSERALGDGLRSLLASGEVARDEVFVMTKGGYFPFDGEMPANAGEYLRRTYIDPGIVKKNEVVAGSHCIAPKYLEDQLRRSLGNLGLQAVDVYFLHNVEQQLEALSPDDFYRRVESAFRFLETQATAGKIRYFGAATWNGLRVAPETQGHLSLERLMQTAEAAGGKEHRFLVVQLPYNLGMAEALTAPTQEVQGKRVSVLDAAAYFGLMVVTSVPLLQTQILPHIPEAFVDRMPGLSTNAQRAIQFARSTPGVLAPLVGMKQLAHVQENTVVAQVDPLPEDQFLKLLGG